MTNRMIVALLATCCLSMATWANESSTAEKPTLIAPLIIGATAPNATMTNTDGESVTLEQLRDGKPTVVVFYRGSW